MSRAHWRMLSRVLDIVDGTVRRDGSRGLGDGVGPHYSPDLMKPVEDSLHPESPVYGPGDRFQREIIACR